MVCVHVVTDWLTVLPAGAAFDYGITIVPSGPADDVERAFAEAYRSLVDMGVDVLSLHAPTALGGAVDQARPAMAAAPDRVTVLELAAVGEALGLLCLDAAHLGQEEAPRAALSAGLATSAAATRQWLAVPAAEGLVELCWVDADWPAAHAGTGSHLVCEIAEGRLTAEGWASDVGDMLRTLATHVTAYAGSAAGGVRLAVASAEADAEAAALASYLESMLMPDRLWRAAYEPALARAFGPGAVGVSVVTA